MWSIWNSIKHNHIKILNSGYQIKKYDVNHDALRVIYDKTFNTNAILAYVTNSSEYTGLAYSFWKNFDSASSV